MDSGAIDHVCNSLHSFLHIRALSGQTHHKTIPNGDSVQVTMIGDASIHDKVILKDVYLYHNFGLI